MIQVGLPMLTGIELRPVSLNKRQQNDEALFQKHSRRTHVSPMFPSFPCGKHCFQCLFLFPKYKLCLRYTAGNFNGSPSMRAVAKILWARASEHLSNFCEQVSTYLIFASNSSKSQSLRALWNWMRPLDTAMHLCNTRVHIIRTG